MTPAFLARIARRAAWAAVVLLVAAHSGCGGQVDPTPPADAARAAVERSLAAWKDGGKPGTVGEAESAVHSVDSIWQNGRKLDAYEILKEEEGQGDRRISVRLKYRDPAGDEELRYVVVGQGPTWVYREDDYRRMLNMDDNPGPTRSKSARRR